MKKKMGVNLTWTKNKNAPFRLDTAASHLVFTTMQCAKEAQRLDLRMRIDPDVRTVATLRAMEETMVKTA